MNLPNIFTISPHHFYRKCVGATNENLNFDLRVKAVAIYSGISVIQLTS